MPYMNTPTHTMLVNWLRDLRQANDRPPPTDDFIDDCTIDTLKAAITKEIWSATLMDLFGARL